MRAESVAPVPSGRPPIEVGWVLAGPMAEADEKAAWQALAEVQRTLEAGLPEFAWQMDVVERREVPLGMPMEPIGLLDVGVFERDASRWDFVFVLTEAPLKSETRPFMLGAPSQAVDVAVLSTARLDPAAEPGGRRHEERVATLTRRIAALVLHLFGHLNDLEHDDGPNRLMHAPRSERDLDHMQHFSDDDWAKLRRRLAQVADPRIEETEPSTRRVTFYLEAAWLNRHEILSGVRRMGAWRFPLRYSRLTTAAVSTQLVLMMTAEAWELGMTQPVLRVAVLSLLALLTTSYYVIHRQHLLSRFGRRPSEQSVVAHMAICIGVLVGMATTYLALFASTWFGARYMFDVAVVRNWTANLAKLDEAHYVSLASFIASAGLVVGALGASFEEEDYFRRVTLLDEET